MCTRGGLLDCRMGDPSQWAREGAYGASCYFLKVLKMTTCSDFNSSNAMTTAQVPEEQWTSG